MSHDAGPRRLRDFDDDDDDDDQPTVNTPVIISSKYATQKYLPRL